MYNGKFPTAVKTAKNGNGTNYQYLLYSMNKEEFSVAEAYCIACRRSRAQAADFVVFAAATPGCDRDGGGDRPGRQRRARPDKNVIFITLKSQIKS